MSYRDVLKVSYGQPDLVQLYSTSAQQSCVTGGIPQYPQANKHDFHTLMESPWVKQYRSMCAEFGRNGLLASGSEKTQLGYPGTTSSKNIFAKPVARITHSNSVGQKVVSFLRGAFRRSTDDTITEDDTLRCVQTSKRINTAKQNKKVECLLSQKSWRSPTRWMSRRKESYLEMKGSLTDKSSSTSKQLFAIRHSGSRSADSFRKGVISPSSRTRDSASAPLDQSNSQNSTPTPRPSALITARSNSDKSREGIAKRTRFSLHPSTCNAPPDLIRPRRDSEETANSLSSLVDVSSRSIKAVISPSLKRGVLSENADKRTNDSTVPLTNGGNMDLCVTHREEKQLNPPGIHASRLVSPLSTEVIENSSTDLDSNHINQPLISSSKQPESMKGSLSSTEDAQSNIIQKNSTITLQDQGRPGGFSKPTSTPIVPVTPMAKILPQRVSSSTAVPERKHVTFEPTVSHSLPSTPNLNMDSLTSLAEETGGAGQSKPSEALRRSVSAENEQQDSMTNFQQKPEDISCSVSVFAEKPPKPTQLNISRAIQSTVVGNRLSSCRTPRRKLCRLKRYRKLIADLDQIYQNYAAPSEFTREFIDEICQSELMQIARSVFKENELIQNTDPVTGIHNTSPIINEANDSKPVGDSNHKESSRSLIPTWCPDLRLSNHLTTDERVTDCSFQNLDEWLGLKPSQHRMEGNSATTTRIHDTSCAERAGDLLDLFPTKDQDTSSSRDLYGSRSLIPISRTSSLQQNWVNPQLKGLRRSLSSASRQWSQQTSPGYQIGRCTVKRVATKAEEAESLEWRSQHLFATLEDNISSELEFSDEHSVVQSDVQSRTTLPLPNRTDYQQEEKGATIRTTERPLNLACHSTQTFHQDAVLDNLQPQMNLVDVSTKHDFSSDQTLLSGNSPTETPFLDHTHKRFAPVQMEPTLIHVSTAAVSPGQTVEQKKNDNSASEEISAANLWNQIHQSLVELSSISDEGLQTAPQQATATVRLERSLSAMARSDTVDSLSPCLSKLGTTLAEFNADVTGFSEPSISTISLPDDVSSVPWTRARIVVLRDTTHSSSMKPTASSAILVRCQVTDTASQTEGDCDAIITNSPTKAQSDEPCAGARVKRPCSCQDHVNPYHCCPSSYISPCSCNRVEMVDNRKECLHCYPHNCVSFSRPVSVSTQVAVQTDKELTVSLSTPGPNNYAVLSPVQGGCQTAKSPICADPVLKNIVKPSSEFVSQFDDVGDCAHRENEAPITKPYESSDLSKVTSSKTINRFISHGVTQSQISAKTILQHPGNAYAFTSREGTELLKPYQSGQIRRKSRAVSQMQRQNPYLLRTSLDSEVSSGDSRFTQSSPLKPRWNISHTNPWRRTLHSQDHKWRSLSNRDTDTDVSDADASSSVSSPRHSCPRGLSSMRKNRIARESKSQPPSFELLRLEDRYSRMSCLPIRTGISLTTGNVRQSSERKTQCTQLTELREMQRHRSVPHLARTSSTLTVPIVSSVPRNKSVQAYSLGTSSMTDPQQQPQNHIRQWDLDSLHTDSEFATVYSTGYRRGNRRKIKSFRSHPIGSLDSSQKSCSVGSVSLYAPHSKVSESLGVHTDVNFRRQLVKRPSREETICNQPSPDTTSCPQVPHRSFNGSVFMQREPSQRSTAFNRTTRSSRRAGPFCGHVLESRPVDDNLLRHTFASLQKVRTKVHHTMTTSTTRPRMIFKR